MNTADNLGLHSGGRRFKYASNPAKFLFFHFTLGDLSPVPGIHFKLPFVSLFLCYVSFKIVCFIINNYPTIRFFEYQIYDTIDNSVVTWAGEWYFKIFLFSS